MKSSPPITTDPSAAFAYEALRGPASGVSTWGRGLIVHRGVATWLRLRAANSTSARAQHTPAPPSPDPCPSPLCSGFDREVTEIITTMVLAAGVGVQ